MDEYTKGALEALAWIQLLIEKGKSKENIRKEIEEARDLLLKGVAVNFKKRVEILSETEIQTL